MSSEEINEAVAKKLGWVLKESQYLTGPPRMNWFDGETNKGPVPPNFCGSIEAAWEIVEYIKLRFYTMTIGELCSEYDDLSGWTWNVKIYQASEVNKHRLYAVSQSADTAPMAIALCFLKLP